MPPRRKAPPQLDTILTNVKDALKRTEAWLDARGIGAWILAIALGFILAWPLGLLLLAYAAWGRATRRLLPPPARDPAENTPHPGAPFAPLTGGAHAHRERDEFDAFLDARAKQARHETHGAG